MIIIRVLNYFLFTFLITQLNLKRKKIARNRNLLVIKQTNNKSITNPRDN